MQQYLAYVGKKKAENVLNFYHRTATRWQQQEERGSEWGGWFVCKIRSWCIE